GGIYIMKIKKINHFRIISMFIIFTLIFSLFIGCSGDEDIEGSSDGADNQESQSDGQEDTSEPKKDLYGDGFTGYPMDTDETLTFWTSFLAPHPEYASPSDSPFHNWISEFTGVKINWEMPAAGADGTQ